MLSECGARMAFSKPYTCLTGVALRKSHLEADDTGARMAQGVDSWEWTVHAGGTDA